MPDPNSVKVVVTGPFGSGKTAFISTLSEITVLTTTRKVATDREGLSETVDMDFGRLTVDDVLPIHLFGTPSRARFDFMWEVVREGMLGFIVLIDDTRADSAAEALSMLKYFRERANVPYVVAVNKVAPAQAERAVRRARHSLRIPDHVRVVAVDVRRRESAKHLLLQLLLAAKDDPVERLAAG